jgi:hypothetical protein
MKADDERAHRLPFDISSLSMTGLVIFRELGNPPSVNCDVAVSRKPNALRERPTEHAATAHRRPEGSLTTHRVGEDRRP